MLLSLTGDSRSLALKGHRPQPYRAAIDHR
jgi:hypothetical protein